MRPQLYLDVDGVVNAQYTPKAWGGRQKGHATTEGYTYPISWAPGMIDALRSLDLDLVWTTTWRDDAVASIAPLVGWGTDGRVLHPNLNPKALTTFPSIEWKALAVAADQRENPTPFIWCDDEIWAYEINLARELGGLAIPVDHNTGITPQNVDMMQDYLASRPLEV